MLYLDDFICLLTVTVCMPCVYQGDRYHAAFLD
jgi:hypothetical protein